MLCPTEDTGLRIEKEWYHEVISRVSFGRRVFCLSGEKRTAPSRNCRGQNLRLLINIQIYPCIYRRKYNENFIFNAGMS